MRRRLVSESTPQNNSSMNKLVIAGAALALASGLSAQVVVSSDFEGAGALTPGYTYGYSYQEADLSSYTNTVLPGVGMGGSQGGQLTLAFAQVTGRDPFWSGGGIGRTVLSGGFVSAPATGVAANYTASFDVAATGMVGPTASLALRVVFQSGPSADLVHLGRTVAVDGTMTTFSFSLDDAGWSVIDAKNDWASVSLGLTERVTMQVQIDGAVPVFGIDGGTIFVDNLSLTQVPEPSTYAAIAGGLALLGVALLRRRKA
jgi:hypothetical protein